MAIMEPCEFSAGPEQGVMSRRTSAHRQLAGGLAPGGPRPSSSFQGRQPSGRSLPVTSGPRQLFLTLLPLCPAPSRRTTVARVLASKSKVMRKPHFQNSFSKVIFTSWTEIAVNSNDIPRGERGFFCLHVDQCIRVPRLDSSKPTLRHCRCVMGETRWRSCQQPPRPAVETNF